MTFLLVAVFLFFGLAIASIVAIVFQYKHRKVVYSSFGVVVVVLSVVGLFLPSDNKKPSSAAEPPKYDVVSPASIVSIPPPKPESKKEYIASTTRIGGKNAPIYYKEFFKNPSKFEGQRINLPGRIMVIEEGNGMTAIQMQVTGNYDSVIVHYDGTVPVYQGDSIMVYGEGGGVQDGFNRMGAAMTWPVIKAKYIVKRASAEE